MTFYKLRWRFCCAAFQVLPLVQLAHCNLVHILADNWQQLHRFTPFGNNLMKLLNLFPSLTSFLSSHPAKQCVLNVL